jgi:hypothetical protein
MAPFGSSSSSMAPFGSSSSSMAPFGSSSSSMAPFGSSSSSMAPFGSSSSSMAPFGSSSSSMAPFGSSSSSAPFIGPSSSSAPFIGPSSSSAPFISSSSSFIQQPQLQQFGSSSSFSASFLTGSNMQQAQQQEQQQSLQQILEEKNNATYATNPALDQSSNTLSSTQNDLPTIPVIKQIRGPDIVVSEMPKQKLEKPTIPSIIKGDANKIGNAVKQLSQLQIFQQQQQQQPPQKQQQKPQALASEVLKYKDGSYLDKEDNTFVYKTNKWSESFMGSQSKLASTFGAPYSLF